MSFPYGSDHPNMETPGLVESRPKDVAEIQQQDYPALDVKGQVEIDGVVRTHELPSRIGVSRAYQAIDTVVTPLVGRDMRRKRMTVLGTSLVGQANASTGFFVGNSEDVRTGNAAFWPLGLPLVLCHTMEVYVRAVTATSPSTAVISVITENWAD